MTIKREVLDAAPLPTFNGPVLTNVVPSKVSVDPLVATLLPFKYRTPLAVPPERVRLDETVAEATDTFVILRLLIVRLVRARFVMLADVADR